MWKCVYIYIFDCMSLSVCDCVYFCLCVTVSVYLCACARVCVFVCVRARVCTCLCVQYLYNLHCTNEICTK